MINLRSKVYVALKPFILYIILSVVAVHPMIENIYVTYENSHGSGPDFFDDLTDPKVFVKNLIKYYHGF